MGTVLHQGQINPRDHPSDSSILTRNRTDVTRADFKFIKKLYSSGVAGENIFWLAANILNPQERFFVKQSCKIKLYNQKKVKAVLLEMKLMTQTTNPHLIKVYHAFQDQEYLYLVTEPIDYLPFHLLINSFPFTEDQTRYVVSALVSVLQDVHSQGYALTELSPHNILFDRTTGTVKVMEMPNPAVIDSYCSVSPVAPICGYSAPEILYRGHVLAESDFYSIGVIIYEMMTQESSQVVPPLSRPHDRTSVLKEEIEVEKSKIPEDWESEAADFLIKVLVKNPALRLGRYGAFEVKTHPWLRNFDPQDRVRRIDFTHFQVNLHNDPLPEEPQMLHSQSSSRLLKSHCFQGFFEGFNFTRRPEPELPSETTSHKTSLLFNESQLELQDTFLL